jgi:hypothetical protein
MFIVYAHDNDPVGEASARCVQQLIGWLKVLRLQVLSDKSALSLWSARAEGTAAAHNILSNQFCLLPKHARSLEVDKISSVDKVLLFGSAVLKAYYEEPSVQSYFSEIEEAWVQAQAQDLDVEELQLRIRRVVEHWCQETALHHVLTELAMLKIRRSVSKIQSHGIIPVALDGVDFRYLSFLDGVTSV